MAPGYLLERNHNPPVIGSIPVAAMLLKQVQANSSVAFSIYTPFQFYSDLPRFGAILVQ
jgi:hypothetical protein